MNDIGKLIASLRKEKRLSQDELARRLNCTKQTVSNYERGVRRPDYEMLEAIADELNVPMSFFISKEEQRSELARIYNSYPSNKTRIKHNNISEQQPVRIPVLGTIPAGVPLDAIEDIIDWEEIPMEMTRGGKEYFCLKINGDSMYPEYRDGDIIVFRRQDTCENGQDCAVMVNGDDATFKRVRINEKGITLQPLNPKYDPYVYNNEDVLNLPVRIIGVATELRRKF